MREGRIARDKERKQSENSWIIRRGVAGGREGQDAGVGAALRCIASTCE